MNITIFGATGKTGVPLVQQALDKGYNVTAFVRTPSKMGIEHERLTLVQGDAMSGADVARAISADTDAVISALGHVRGGNTPSNMQTVATSNIIGAMERHGVKRLVSLTGGGVRAAGDEPKLMDRIMRFALKTLQKDVLTDAENHFEVMKQHPEIEWVLVRGPMLTEEPAKGSIKVDHIGGDVGIRLSREDLAAFMLEQVESDRWVHKAPFVSN